jgi:putative phosphoesterase
MQIGILSDTHDKLERTRIAVDLLRSAGAEMLFHCGDLTSPSIIKICAVLPGYFVLGNNDWDMAGHLQAAATDFGMTCLGWGDVVSVGDKRIGVVHGHLATDLRRVQALNPDYIFSGHSHIPSDSRVGSARRINPGALHRANEFSVALLDLKSDELRFLTVPRSREPQT